MRVLITGGTGFVGSHAVAALARDGHQIRLLVRDSARIEPALRPLGLTGPLDHVIGDVTDPDAVERALEGCDAVVHAAAVFRIDARSDARIRDTNAPGARLVLERAVALGLDPVIHVSTSVALLNRRAASVTPYSPLTRLKGAYVSSKVASERIARSLQERGAPVTTIYPGVVYGPHDPHLSDNMERLRDIVRGFYPLWPKGGMHVVDVRDCARVIAAAMKPGAGPRRYAVPGEHVSGPVLYGTLRRVTGRRLPVVFPPPALMKPGTWLVAKAQRVLPFHVPAEHAGVQYIGEDTRVDHSATTADFGIEPMGLERSLRDSIEWLREAGHL